MRQVFCKYIAFQIMWQFPKLNLIVIMCMFFKFRKGWKREARVWWGLVWICIKSPVTCNKDCTFNYEVIIGFSG